MWKRSVQLALGLLLAVVGCALLLVDVWVVAAVYAANYRRWPAHGRSEPAHPWLWLVVLPLTAALLIYGGYALRRLSRRLGHPDPKAQTEATRR